MTGTDRDAAFSEFVASRQGHLRRIAYALCGDWHRADDHTQGAFVALHRHWRRVRDKGALDAWMRRTLMRAVVDESRRPWRRERFTDDVVAVDKVVADPDVDGRIEVEGGADLRLEARGFGGGAPLPDPAPLFLHHAQAHRELGVDRGRYRRVDPRQLPVGQGVTEEADCQPR